MTRIISAGTALAGMFVSFGLFAANQPTFGVLAFIWGLIVATLIWGTTV